MKPGSGAEAVVRHRIRSIAAFGGGEEVIHNTLSSLGGLFRFTNEVHAQLTKPLTKLISVIQHDLSRV